MPSLCPIEDQLSLLLTTQTDSLTLNEARGFLRLLVRDQHFPEGRWGMNIRRHTDVDALAVIIQEDIGVDSYSEYLEEFYQEEGRRHFPEESINRLESLLRVSSTLEWHFNYSAFVVGDPFCRPAPTPNIMPPVGGTGTTAPSLPSDEQLLASNLSYNDLETTVEQITGTFQVTSSSEITIAEEENTPRNILQERPRAHGVNDVAHNLGVMYRNCYAQYQNQLIYIRNFFNSNGMNSPDNKIMVEFFQGPSLLTVEYSPTMIEFIYPRLGWIPHAENYLYMEYMYGGFLRGMGWSNTRLVAAILAGKPTTRMSLEDVRNKEILVKTILNRQFYDLKDGLDPALPHMQINEDLILIQFKRGEAVRHLLFYMDLCVGEVHRSRKYIKIYKPYSNLLEHLKGVIPYEIR